MFKKKCPACAKKIEKKFSYCPYCGISFKSGNNEKALELYRRIKDEYQFTVYMSKAEREISNILIQE